MASMEEDKKKLAQQREERTKAYEEHKKKRTGTPVPTQEECDLIKLGHHPELAKDGSEEDPNVGFSTKQLEGERSERSGYQTRHTTATHSPSRTPSSG